jgi:hypothetical protein
MTSRGWSTIIVRSKNYNPEEHVQTAHRNIRAPSSQIRELVGELQSVHAAYFYLRPKQTSERWVKSLFTSSGICEQLHKN